MKRLRRNHVKEILPVQPMKIKVDLMLMKVRDSHDKREIFESVIALFMEWKDPRMKWNPEFYDNVTIVTFLPFQIWTPDIAMLNSADHHYAVTRDEDFLIRLSPDGTLRYIPSGPSRSWCELGLVAFPFDIQICTFEFESWSLTTDHLIFDNNSNIYIDVFFDSPQWQLCSSQSFVYNHRYNTLNDPFYFARVRFEIVVRRKSMFYIINLILPCTLYSFVQSMIFMQPLRGLVLIFLLTTPR